ncbi:M23 family metallopeptidase [Thermodesulfovibrio yellowstonii]|uniref:Peptidase, family M23/M37 domain protein n=1 Tax=Thermodesulfovibrio yellowstonii (strain ATCC 51303 / DSM 11347 / YP87) TaxID=289376 RepID=B5YIX0_THEYD|nr:M23 family metallopeptidase [Thermodesulfovibrio yellowstonii]ACI20825.1 peptidase, family M23/M37 domain protein [Thermodesulfovibrio yellowstonii DSM 11347]
MINKVNTQTLNTSTDTKELSKKIETIFLTELLKVMFANTSFSEGKTTSTYMTAILPQIAEMMSERDIGIGRFLTENANFLNSISKNQKIELKPSLDNQEEQRKFNLPNKISLPASGKITSPFGLRTDPIDGKLRHHNGIDIAVPEGTEIKPALSGKVVYSGYSNGYGNCVIVEHENGIQTIYAHNSKNLVKVGDTVTADTVIALSGSTGRTTGPHLHFEVRKDGKPVNPVAMLNSLEKSPIS